MSESQVSVPLPVRLRFGHAALQHIADGIAVDVLHIKGAAVDPTLRPPELYGTDVDVIVRPDQFPRLDRELRRHGWRVYTTFASGSPFGHAQTYMHEAWGYVDVHRFFPGIRLAPAAAFARLWRDRHSVQIAGHGCPVPSVPAQSLLLILNVARAGGASAHDLAAAWTDASDDRRREIEALVDDLDAPVAFAAATGGIERYRDERDYRLWKVITEGGTRTAEWRARIRAAPTFGDKVALVARAPLVNVDHLAHRLGRAPTRRDIVGEFFARPARAVGEALRALRRKVAR